MSKNASGGFSFRSVFYSGFGVARGGRRLYARIPVPEGRMKRFRKFSVAQREFCGPSFFRGEFKTVGAGGGAARAVSRFIMTRGNFLQAFLLSELRNGRRPRSRFIPTARGFYRKTSRRDFFSGTFFSRICFNAAPGRQRPDACIYLCRRAPRRGFENSGFPERIWRLKFLPAARGALQAPVRKIAARAATFFIMPFGNYRGLI